MTETNPAILRRWNEVMEHLRSYLMGRTWYPPVTLHHMLGELHSLFIVDHYMRGIPNSSLQEEMIRLETKILELI